jgi:carbonic anhydrase
LFIACSDSRVVPNLFASTDPGDLFVVRNVGNIIPPCSLKDQPSVFQAEAAAIQFSMENLEVRNIIVCGHSECGAINAVLSKEKDHQPHDCSLHAWLHYIYPSLERLKAQEGVDPSLLPHNQLSQLNVLQQLEHLKSYPMIQKRIQQGSLKVHGWWFDIGKADVYCYDEVNERFILIDEQNAEKIISSTYIPDEKKSKKAC